MSQIKTKKIKNKIHKTWLKKKKKLPRILKKKNRHLKNA